MKQCARSAHLREIKILRERRGSGGAKRAMVFKVWENDRASENVALGDMANVSFSSSKLSPSHVKASNRAPNELRRPLMPIAVVRSRLEEDADADVWVDTDVHKDDVVVASEWGAVLN